MVVPRKQVDKFFIHGLHMSAGVMDSGLKNNGQGTKTLEKRAKEGSDNHLGATSNDRRRAAGSLHPG